MKAIKNIWPAALTALLLTGCNLDYAPENTLVDEKVYKNEKTAEAALLGDYVRMNVFYAGAPQDQNNYANSGYTILMGDLTTDNLSVRSSATGYLAVQSSRYTSAEHDGLLSNIWQWGYNAIDYANNIINKIDAFGEFDGKMKRQFVAEAKFIRAYVYFCLLCIYGDMALLGNDDGEGVVVRLEAYNGYNPDDVTGRSSNRQCWEQIIKDLETDALPDLPDGVPAVAYRIRANKTVAKALLSRIYLYKGTYTGNRDELAKARDYAADVLATPGYSFSADNDEIQSALFPCNEYSQSGSYPDPPARSNEVIFFQPSRIYTDNYPNGMYYYRKQSFCVSEMLKNIYDDNDVRKTYLIWQGSKSDYPNDCTTMKYGGGQYDDVLYLRLAEMKLTFAEASARLEGRITAEALQQLNDVRRRAFPDDMKPDAFQISDFPTPDAFIREVLRERNRELAFEGHYRWDLMRTGNMLNDITLGAVDKSRWNMPVPDYEIKISYGAIRQNSGYKQ